MGIQFLAVGLGGAIGACGRYLLSFITWKGSFPMVTMMINILGSFFIGFVSAYAKQFDLKETWVLFLKTGICGGFTTFSTFSLENVQLLENRAVFTAISYMICSILCCLLGVLAGQWSAGKLHGLLS